MAGAWRGLACVRPFHIVSWRDVSYHSTVAVPCPVIRPHYVCVPWHGVSCHSPVLYRCAVPRHVVSSSICVPWRVAWRVDHNLIGVPWRGVSCHPTVLHRCAVAWRVVSFDLITQVCRGVAWRVIRPYYIGVPWRGVSCHSTL